EEIYRTPSTEFVAEFMGMSNRMPLPEEGTIVRFRPEAVALQPANAPKSVADALFTLTNAEVMDRAFTGECIEYALAAGALPLKARVTAKPDSPGIGDR